MTASGDATTSTDLPGQRPSTETPLSPAGNPIGFGRMLRKEDVRFLRGRGNYLDDVTLPGMLHGAILRSPIAHGRIARIDTSAAEAHPQVKAVITGALLESLNLASRARRSRSSSLTTSTPRAMRSSSSTSTTSRCRRSWTRPRHSTRTRP